jgi:hypothetical protein
MLHADDLPACFFGQELKMQAGRARRFLIWMKLCTNYAGARLKIGIIY